MAAAAYVKLGPSNSQTTTLPLQIHAPPGSYRYGKAILLLGGAPNVGVVTGGRARLKISYYGEKEVASSLAGIMKTLLTNVKIVISS